MRDMRACVGDALAAASELQGVPGPPHCHINAIPRSVHPTPCRAAYLSHGDGIGALSRRRARGPRPLSSRAGDLPPGFRLVVKVSSGSESRKPLIEASS